MDERKKHSKELGEVQKELGAKKDELARLKSAYGIKDVPQAKTPGNEPKKGILAALGDIDDALDVAPEAKKDLSRGM